MNSIDCTHNLKSIKMCTLQRGHGEEAIQPDYLETIFPNR